MALVGPGAVTMTDGHWSRCTTSESMIIIDDFDARLRLATSECSKPQVGRWRRPRPPGGGGGINHSGWRCDSVAAAAAEAVTQSAGRVLSQ